MIHCWGIVGIRILLAEASFVVPPLRLAGNVPAFESSLYSVATEKYQKFDVPYDKGLPTQERFRQVLDSSGSLEQALSRFREGDY
jgi:hypothetical protein